MDRLNVTPDAGASNVSLSEEYTMGINVQLKATDAEPLWHRELSWALNSIFEQNSRHLAGRAERLEPPSGPNNKVRAEQAETGLSYATVVGVKLDP